MASEKIQKSIGERFQIAFDSNNTAQLPTELRDSKFIVFVFRRYGYLCSYTVPTYFIKQGTAANGITAMADLTRYITFKVDSSLLVTIVDNTIGANTVEGYGIY